MDYKKLLIIFFACHFCFPAVAQYYREIDAYNGPLFKTSLTCTKIVDGKEVPQFEKRCGEYGIVTLVKDSAIVPAFQLQSVVKTEDTSGARIDTKYFVRDIFGKIDTLRVIYTLDPASGKIGNIIELRPNGDTMTQISYTYNTYGFVERFEIQHRGISWKRYETHEYLYDSLGRIKSVYIKQSDTAPGGPHSWSSWQTIFFYNGKERSYWSITVNTSDRDWRSDATIWISAADLPFQNTDTKSWKEGVTCSKFYCYSYVECDRKKRPIKTTRYMKESKDVFVYRFRYQK